MKTFIYKVAKRLSFLLQADCIAYKIQQKLAFLLTIVLLFSLTGCFRQYYQTNSVSRADSSLLEQLKAEKKHFVLHTGSGAYELQNLKLDNEMMNAELHELSAKHEYYLNPKPDVGNLIPYREKKWALSQVHIYTAEKFDSSSKANLPLNQINRLDIYGPDRKDTRESTIMSIAGIALIGVATAVVANNPPHWEIFDFHAY